MMTSIRQTIHDFVSAVEDETAAYTSGGSRGITDGEAEVATDRVIAAERALLAVPLADLHAEMLSNGDLDYVQAVALAHRRWLVMEGGYQSESKQTECRLVDMILLPGSRIADVPMLWHLSGETRDERPSDAELQATWKGL